MTFYWNIIFWDRC